MLWLYLDFHSLQLDGLDSTKQASRTELTPKPSVIIIVDPKKNEVVQLNKAAFEQGMKLGLGLATALSLHQQVNVIEYKPAVEFRTLQQIAQLLYQFTADIALSSPHGMYLRIDNMLCLYHGLSSYWQQLKQVLTHLGYQYHYATGSTPLMAKLLAQAQFNMVLDDPKALRHALNKLPIEELELEPKARDVLLRVGVKKAEQLLHLSLRDMAKRFDIHLLNHIGKLLGEFKHGLIFFQPPAQFEVDIELLFEIENSEILHHPIKRLLVQLEQFLSIRGLVTQQITLRLFYRYQVFIEVQISRAQGEYKIEKWLSLVRLKLENVKLSEPVISISLLATQLRPLNAGSGDLFHNKTPQVSRDELLAVIQAKLGDEKVKGLTLVDQHNPQLATHYGALFGDVELSDLKFEGSTHSETLNTKPFFNKTKKSKSGNNKTRKGSVSSQTAATENRLGSAGLTQSKGGQFKLRPSLMAAIATPLKEHITILHGPERLQTSWWHEHSILRDYFVARSDSGRLCWVYRTPQKNWYLQGYFS